jgi:hypothetical protein
MMLLTYFFYINLYNEIYIFFFLSGIQPHEILRHDVVFPVRFSGHVEIHGIAKVVLQLLISSLPVS